jgi:hypothetical protein
VSTPSRKYKHSILSTSSTLTGFRSVDELKRKLDAAEATIGRLQREHDQSLPPDSMADLPKQSNANQRTALEI